MRKTFLAFILLLAVPLSASIELSETLFQLTLPVGGSHAGSVRVKNVTKSPLRITAVLEDWKYDKPGGSKRFFPAGTLPHSCAKWTTFSPDSFELAPGQEQEVRFSLTVPPGAAGGYHASVTFSSSPSAPKNVKGVMISVAMKVGSLILLEVENTRKVKGAVTEFAPLAAAAGRPLEVRAKFKNLGNVRIEAKGRLSIQSAAGDDVGWTVFPPIKTLPGDEWAVVATWANGLPAGKYHLVGTFELAPGVLVVKETDVHVK